LGAAVGSPVLGTRPGSEIQKPLAVVGGLVTSTLLTLVVIPALYGWFESKRRAAAPED
jgi:cobalt-zinc-cadmium resistance protein CzcA